MTKEILFSEEERIDDREAEIESPSREEEEVARLKKILDEFGIEIDPAEVLGVRV